jgi:CspA family cold shock protein
MSQRHTGTIKFFTYRAGYGIITPDDGGPDVFLHKAICEKSGYVEMPSAGMEVEYEQFQSRKGYRASWVRYE